MRRSNQALLWAAWFMILTCLMYWDSGELWLAVAVAVYLAAHDILRELEEQERRRLGDLTAQPAADRQPVMPTPARRANRDDQ